MPSLQVSPVPHALPQVPQFAVSVFTSVHPALHFVLPVSHVHAPPLQVSPVPHAVPHLPQLAGSVLVFTHDPLHGVSPVPQLGVVSVVPVSIEPPVSTEVSLSVDASVAGALGSDVEEHAHRTTQASVRKRGVIGARA